MAATTSTPPGNQGTPGHSTQAHPAQAHPPVSLEPAIEALLGQQAEITAKLAFLLPQKYSINIKSELDNLRHKLRVLRTFAENHREPHRPFLFIVWVASSSSAGFPRSNANLSRTPVTCACPF